MYRVLAVVLFEPGSTIGSIPHSSSPDWLSPQRRPSFSNWLNSESIQLQQKNQLYNVTDYNSLTAGRSPTQRSVCLSGGPRGGGGGGGGGGDYNSGLRLGSNVGWSSKNMGGGGMLYNSPLIDNTAVCSSLYPRDPPPFCPRDPPPFCPRDPPPFSPRDPPPPASLSSMDKPTYTHQYHLEQC